MNNIFLKIQPDNKNWKDLNLEMMVDEGNMLFEIHNLEFTGNSMIEDPKTKTKERIEFRAPIQTCQIVVSLGEEYA